MSIILHESNEDVDLNNLNYNDLLEYCQFERYVIQKFKRVMCMQIIDNILFDHKYDKIREDNYSKIKRFTRSESLKRIEKIAAEEEEEEESKI